MNNGKKFSICIQNPPYDRDLHLDFLDKSLEVCDKIIIIEPAQWLVQLKQNGKYTKENSKAENIKKKIENHIKSVDIENVNSIFNTANKTTFNIMSIDMTKNIDNFEYKCCGEKREADSIYDCNLIGDYNLVQSILTKCKNYKDHMIDHVINLRKYKDYEDKGYYFLRYANYMINNLGTMQTHSWTKAFHCKTNLIDSLNSYFAIGCDEKCNITNKIYVTPKGNAADSIYSKNKDVLINWHYFIYNNKLPLFVNICLTIDEHNNSREYLPWLVDKQYTDEEIYKILDITEEEQKLINKTIENFDKDSKFGKKYFSVKGY